MSPLASIALSGLNAATVRQATSAHNVANAMTPAFRRQVVQQQALPEGGVTTSIGRAADIGDALAEDLVDQKMAAYAFKANLLTLQTHDRMLGTLLDLQA